MTSTWPLVVVSGLCGATFGSFANVAVHRWPSGGTVATPRESRCPRCGAAIRARDNVPVVSWLLLRGRCRDCGEPIALRYPLIEALTAALFAAVAVVFGANWLLPALLVLTWALVVATAIDLEHRIIPNRLTYRLPLFLLPLLVLAAWQQEAWADLQRAVVAGVAVPAGMFVLSETFRLLRGVAGIGMGDVKLAVSLGLALGYLGGWELVIAFYATVVTAVVVALGLIAAGRAKLATRIPFGPYLAVGTLVAILAGDPLSTWLERVFVP